MSAARNFLRRLFGPKETPRLPEALWQDTLHRLPFLAGLSDDEQRRLRALTEDFLDQKEFSAVGGLQLSDEMCASIAVQGCLPILNLGLECYRGWVGIIVYPDEFVVPRTIEDEDGVIHEYDEIAAGEAWSGGPLLISWQDVQMAGSGYNVVIHEFAHKLDMLNGEADGVPPLPPDLPRQEWENVMLAAYDDFCDRVDAAEADSTETEIDPYAAEHPGEFFAVLSEAFFEDPRLVREHYPKFYSHLSRFYGQDPAARLAAEHATGDVMHNE